MNHSLRVIVGLPVYNGQNFLSEAIESVLTQTLTDFRLVISDNASTDATEAICLKYAKQDSRIIYYRQPFNIGCSPNFNFLFKQHGKDAPYFKWLACDDLIAPEFLERAVAMLEANPNLVLANCRGKVINEQGTQIGTLDREVRLAGSSPSERFRRSLWAGYFTEHFGLQRSSILEKTRLHGSFTGGDRTFVAELILRGEVGYVEEYLFSRRDHPDCYCRIKDGATKLGFFNSQVERGLWRLTGLVKLQAYVSAIVKSALPLNEKLRCIGMLAEWAVRRGIESVTGVGEKFGTRFRHEFAANREWSDQAQGL